VFSFHLKMLGSWQESFLFLSGLLCLLVFLCEPQIMHLLKIWQESKNSTLFFQHHLGTQKLYSLTLLLHSFALLWLLMVHVVNHPLLSGSQLFSL
jgi:hypothetical protein